MVCLYLNNNIKQIQNNIIKENVIKTNSNIKQRNLRCSLFIKKKARTDKTKAINDIINIKYSTHFVL